MMLRSEVPVGVGHADGIESWFVVGEVNKLSAPRRAG